MQKIFKGFLFLILIAFFYSCSEIQDKGNKFKAVDVDNMDTSVRPQDDFYKYVNGKWLMNNEIPDDLSSRTIGIDLYLRTEKDLMDILTDDKNNSTYEKGTDEYKAYAYYSTLIDTLARDEQGIEPLMPYLERIEAISSLKELHEVIRYFNPYFSSMFYGFGIVPDRLNSDLNRAYVGIIKGRLPERDYYLLQDEESKSIREKYKNHIVRILTMIGDKPDDAKGTANKVLEIETRIAGTLMSKEEKRDPRKTYNPMTVDSLVSISQNIEWKRLFEPLGLKSNDTIVLTQPIAAKKMSEMLVDIPLEELKTYMRWLLVDDMATLLTTNLDYANWEFYGKELNGSKKQRTWSERGFSAVNGSPLGEAIGKVYIKEKFPPEAKQKAERLVNNLFKAYEKRIANLDWMSEATKEKAIEKLNSLGVKIGYPDKWTDFSNLDLTAARDGGKFFENTKNFAEWVFNEELEKLKRPVDKSKWLMHPQDINAYYAAPYNEIVFPAGILQPPYFDYKADMAVNYGSIGGVIGHEISHAFDDQGSRFDASGNLNNWWTEDDYKKFKKKGEHLIEQFSTKEALPGVFVNGEFTLGENIGDLGGLASAYDALQIDIENYGNPGKIDGFTQKERFFISWASTWKQLMRDEYIKKLIKTDPHAPGMFRGYVPLLNMDEFHETFKTKPGDAMYLPQEERIKIW